MSNLAKIGKRVISHRKPARTVHPNHPRVGIYKDHIDLVLQARMWIDPTEIQARSWNQLVHQYLTGPTPDGPPFLRTTSPYRHG